MAKSYPSQVTAEWLKKYMTKLHFGRVHPDELEYMDTDWDNPVFISGSFKLVRVPLSKLINTVPSGTDEMLAEDYAELKTPFPPIVLDSRYNILDGNHRAMAASFRGDKDIQAYMPVGKKVGFLTIRLGSLSAPHTKVAISVPELVSQTNSFSVKRRPSCDATLLDSNPKELFLHYNVKCRESYSSPEGHDVRVKFDVSQVQDTQNANDLDVQLNCSCPAFLYWGAQWNLHQRDGLLGKPRPELVAPTERLDLRGNFVICKHCKAVLERIIPSVQHNIINIVREIEVRKNKEQLKQKETPESPDRLKKRQDEMKKRQEIKRIRKMKNKEIQRKLLDALRQQQEGDKTLDKVKQKETEDAPDVVSRDEPATDIPVVETTKYEDITKEEPEDEEDLTALTENEEQKLREEQHKKIKHQPHLHKGLPYEAEEEKQDHGHKVPTDEELIEALDATREKVERSTERTKQFLDDMKKRRKQTSLEASLLDAVAEGTDV